MKWYNFIFVFLAFVLLVGCTQPQTIVVSEKNQDVNTLGVEGVAEFETAPDQAVLTFAIETQDKDAKAAQSDNREKANEVMNALWRLGIDKDQIETTYYNLYKITEWENQRRVDKGYRVTNTMKITIDNLNDVGDVIDAVVSSGVNRVNDVSFKLSDKRKAEVKAEALRIAAENAKTKAEALALGADVTLGKVRSIQELSYSTYSVRTAYAEKVMAAGGMDEEAYMPQTPISPEQVQVQVKVKIVYSI